MGRPRPPRKTGTTWSAVSGFPGEPGCPQTEHQDIRPGARSRRGRSLVLVHREAGPVSTFTTRDEAEAELAAVLEDEPDWRPDLWVEPFRLVVTEDAY